MKKGKKEPVALRGTHGQHNKCPKCNQIKTVRAVLCNDCAEHNSTNGSMDANTLVIRQTYIDNLGSDIKNRALARQLKAEDKRLSDLTEDQIRNRLERARRWHEGKLKDSVIRMKDFSVLGSPVNVLDGERLMNDTIRRSEAYLAKVLKEDKRTIAREDDMPIGIAFVADQHIGAKGAWHKGMIEDAELIRDTPGLYAMLGGDGWDNMIKYIGGIINASSTPSEQVAMFSYYMSIFQHKIMAAISGNHEAWTKTMAGLDVVQRLMEDRRIVYNKGNLLITLKVGTPKAGVQDYTIAIAHKTRFNSDMNPTHTIKRYYDYGEAQFDVGVRGDHHEAHSERFHRHGQVRLAVRIGSYQLWSDHSSSLGYPKVEKQTPLVIFYPRARRFENYDDLREGAEVLTAIRYQWRRKHHATADNQPRQLTGGKTNGQHSTRKTKG